MQIFLFIFALFFATGVQAQYAGKQLVNDATAAPDLIFPQTSTPLSEATSPRMMLLMPEGSGPGSGSFPAVVLAHQCGGLIFNKANPKAVNWSMLNWAKTFVAQGYVTLLIDFMDQREAKSVCQMPQNGVNFGRTVKDFYQAAQYLRAIPGIDSDKLALVGFSQGALVSFLANSPNVRDAFNLGQGFNAHVAFYPLCGYSKNGPGNFEGRLVQDDMDRPHLVFTGGLDNETPFADCQKILLPMIEKGKPVQYKHFETATHCFDCSSLNGFTKMGRFGQVTYTYDEEITRQATRQMFEFLDTSFKKK